MFYDLSVHQIIPFQAKKNLKKSTLARIACMTIRVGIQQEFSSYVGSLHSTVYLFDMSKTS